ncbi:RNA-binding protein [Macrococcoides caseolyticum]|uniref:YlmH family RNA-binding protein n=1 Tax=Macrococcoides caseolyticum TaxID=69966 RepID=UPI001F48C845|nr:YlmH/Sll1252 family protein [Macrococcus caseolyticus]MCE4956863.1 RNA-binding protein [Macrococcus caseolyticus]
MNLYQHFRSEEIEVVKFLEGLVERAATYYSPVLTHFLDPRQQFILTTLVNRTDLHVAFNGGRGERERVRALIYPDYHDVSNDDFEIAVIEIKYADKFVTLTHRNVLGALMSIGFKRDFLGDIIIGDKVQFVIARHLKDYVFQNLTQLKGSTIRLNEIDSADMLDVTEDFTTHQSTVASLRLDNIVALMINKSRSIAQKHIEAEHVKVNHVVIDKTSFNVETNDLISIKGYGRGRIEAIGDRTKKDKIRITYGTMFK